MRNFYFANFMSFDIMRYTNRNISDMDMRNFDAGVSFFRRTKKMLVSSDGEHTSAF